MRPIGEASDDCRDYGDYVNGVVSEEFNRFVNYNYVNESEDIIEDDYIAVEYSKYFIEKRKLEDVYSQKQKEENMKKDQALWTKALSLLKL